MATAEAFRQLALGLEGTTEVPHFERRAFRVARNYATLAADGMSANFKFSVDEQTFKCMLLPSVFSPVPNAWGRQGWTYGLLQPMTQEDLKDALEAAWRHALGKRLST